MRNEELQDEIIDRVGAQNWGEVVNEFSGRDAQEIAAGLDKMFPEEEEGNRELAEMIHTALL